MNISESFHIALSLNAWFHKYNIDRISYKAREWISKTPEFQNNPHDRDCNYSPSFLRFFACAHPTPTFTIPNDVGRCTANGDWNSFVSLSLSPRRPRAPLYLRVHACAHARRAVRMPLVYMNFRAFDTPLGHREFAQGREHVVVRARRVIQCSVYMYLPICSERRAKSVSGRTSAKDESFRFRHFFFCACAISLRGELHYNVASKYFRKRSIAEKIFHYLSLSFSPSFSFSADFFSRSAASVREHESEKPTSGLRKLEGFASGSLTLARRCQRRRST